VRNGISGEDFVKEVANKGYTDNSRSLDHVVDLELYLHKTKINGEYYLTVQRGKDRRPTIVPDELLYTKLKFPTNGAPISANHDDLYGVGGEGGSSEGDSIDDLF